MKTLCPMDIEEFLAACSEEELVARIKDCFANDAPMPAVLHKQVLNYYRQYLVVGGMSDCVSKFKENEIKKPL